LNCADNSCATTGKAGEGANREVTVVLSLANYTAIIVDPTRHQDTVAAGTADKKSPIESRELTRRLCLRLKRDEHGDEKNEYTRRNSEAPDF